MAMEPMLRRVVNEEVERVIHQSCTLTRSPSLRIEAPPKSSTLQFVFTKNLLLPIFTGTKIVDAESNPLQLLLMETSGDQMVPTSLPYPIKIEIVVLDGDFPHGDCNSWSSGEFDRKIVRERTGKRPLIAGEVIATLRDDFANIGSIEFTDNSRWIRSRKFRLGARVVPGSRPDVRIREAITEAFVVKDHRGELYKKHHPPSLHDEVWRLEKIGKNGAFHGKLASMMSTNNGATYQGIPVDIDARYYITDSSGAVKYTLLLQDLIVAADDAASCIIINLAM